MPATRKDGHLDTQKHSCGFVKPESGLFWVIPSLEKPQLMAQRQSFWPGDLTEGRDEVWRRPKRGVHKRALCCITAISHLCMYRPIIWHKAYTPCHPITGRELLTPPTGISYNYTFSWTVLLHAAYCNTEYVLSPAEPFMSLRMPGSTVANCTDRQVLLPGFTFSTTTLCQDHPCAITVS